MRLIKGLTLNDMGDSFVVVSENSEKFRGMIRLNKSGAYIFRLLETGISCEDLIENIINKYDVTEDTAKKDLDKFICVFQEADLLEND